MSLWLISHSCHSIFKNAVSCLASNLLELYGFECFDGFYLLDGRRSSRSIPSFGCFPIGSFRSIALLEAYFLTRKKQRKRKRGRSLKIEGLIVVYELYFKMYKIPSGGGAAPPCPAPAPQAGYLCISWIYLEIFGYHFGIFIYIPKWNFPDS